MTDRLERYREMRDFSITPEPRGRKATRKKPTLHYYIQRHDATRLHYDFRLELDGVLKSWAVPKGPSLVPADKRLAVETEPHPLEYGTFEGTIAEGEYGAGHVEIWDHGTWQPEGDARRDYERGRLSFTLKGEKLNGAWHLVRTNGGKDGKQWLLIKSRDAFAHAEGGGAPARERSEPAEGGGAPARERSKPAEGGGAPARERSEPAEGGGGAVAKRAAGARPPVTELRSLGGRRGRVAAGLARRARDAHPVEGAVHEEEHQRAEHD